MWLCWLECCRINQKVMGLISDQDTCLSGRFVPWSRGNRFVFFSHSNVLPLSLSLSSPSSKINEHVLSWGSDYTTHKAPCLIRHRCKKGGLYDLLFITLGACFWAEVSNFWEINWLAHCGFGVSRATNQLRPVPCGNLATEAPEKKEMKAL